MNHTRGLVAALMTMLALAVAGVGQTRAATPRAAAARGVPVSRCTASRGTIVAVDFGHWGGPIVRGCAVRQTSGYALLHSVGFVTVGDAHDGPGFICRIADASFGHGAGYPSSARQSCATTPSATAYWSSWEADAGERRWHYSQTGAMNDVPQAGEVELWTFGATNIAGTSGSGVPSLSPARLRASGDAGRGGAVRLVDALPTAEHAAAGSAAPLIIGICIALALCLGAGLTVRRRRSYQ